MLFCAVATYQFRNATYEERLLAYLFSDYDPVARAAVNIDEPVRVDIDFVLLRIHGLVCISLTAFYSLHHRHHHHVFLLHISPPASNNIT